MRSPELRHEVPLIAPDPLIYVEQNGSRHVFAGALEVPRLAELDGLSAARLRGARKRRADRRRDGPQRAEQELVVRACERLGVDERDRSANLSARGRRSPARPGRGARDRRRALRPPPPREDRGRARRDSPRRPRLGARVRPREGRSAGPDRPARASRRRSTSFSPRPGSALPDCRSSRTAPRRRWATIRARGRSRPASPSFSTSFRRIPSLGCFSDMTRTFCVGEAPAELVEYHRLCPEALDRALRAIKPGVAGKELHRFSASSSRSTASRRS